MKLPRITYPLAALLGLDVAILSRELERLVFVLGDTSDNLQIQDEEKISLSAICFNKKLFEPLLSFYMAYFLEAVNNVLVLYIPLYYPVKIECLINIIKMMRIKLDPVQNSQKHAISGIPKKTIFPKLKVGSSGNVPNLGNCSQYSRWYSLEHSRKEHLRTYNKNISFVQSRITVHFRENHYSSPRDLRT